MFLGAAGSWRKGRKSSAFLPDSGLCLLFSCLRPINFLPLSVSPSSALARFLRSFITPSRKLSLHLSTGIPSELLMNSLVGNLQCQLEEWRAVEAEKEKGRGPRVWRGLADSHLQRELCWPLTDVPSFDVSGVLQTAVTTCNLQSRRSQPVKFR